MKAYALYTVPFWWPRPQRHRPKRRGNKRGKYLFLHLSISLRLVSRLLRQRTVAPVAQETRESEVISLDVRLRSDSRGLCGQIVAAAAVSVDWRQRGRQWRQLCSNAASRRCRTIARTGRRHESRRRRPASRFVATLDPSWPAETEPSFAHGRATRQVAAAAKCWFIVATVQIFRTRSGDDGRCRYVFQ